MEWFGETIYQIYLKYVHNQRMTMLRYIIQILQNSRRLIQLIHFISLMNITLRVFYNKKNWLTVS